MGCFGSTTRNLQFPTYHAILNEIFDLVSREESLRQFTKKSEITKYLQEFDWIKIAAQFKGDVKTLTDHIESCKIRLNDSALFVENKIKMTQNPIVIKMCMLILLEFVQNLHKFTQSKEIPVLNQTHEESKIEVSQRSIQIEQLQTLTQVSDNFLKFELAFSNILSQLINEKMVYAMVWWEYLLQTLELFSKKTTKQFQSENISCILTFLEYIIGTKLGYPDQFEWITKNQEEQLIIIDLLDSIKDPYGIVVVYKDTLTLIPPERLFVTKSQKQLLSILLKDRNKYKEQPAWFKLIETFLQRILNQQLYEELFQMIFCNFDEDQWKNPQDIIQITYVVLEVAKDINQLSNTELFIFSKLIDYLDMPIDKTIYDSPSGPPPLMKKGSEYKQQQANPIVKNSIIKLLSDLFHNIDSNQFILFQQSQTIKALLNNLKTNHELETFNDTKLCLIALLKQISSDSNSVQLFVQQIITFTYNYYQNLINNQAINVEILNSLLTILHQCVQKIDQYHQNLNITEEVILMLIEIAEYNSKIQYLCAEILITVFVQASKIYSNENNEINSSLIPNQNIVGLSAYFLSNAALVSSATTHSDNILINQFFDFIPGRLSNQQIISILAYLIDENSIKTGSKQTKSNRKYLFDQYKDKELRLCMIIKLISFLEEEIAKNYNTILYQILGPQFQLQKKKGFSAYQDIQTLLESKNINTEMQQILSLCVQQNPIDFEKIRKQFKENLSNQNHQNGIINLDDIQVKEDLDRGSIMNQSFQAPSHIEVQLDESFEKQLQTIKKQKMKQDKLEHLTTEQKDMMEY